MADHMLIAGAFGLPGIAMLLARVDAMLRADEDSCLGEWL